MAAGAERGEVEGAAHGGAATLDEASSGSFATVAIIGGESGQGRDLGAAGASQFGHVAQEDGAGMGAYATD